MKLLIATLLASLILATPAWALSCRHEQPRPLKDYVQQVAAEYPVIMEVRLLDLKPDDGGATLTLEVNHIWKGPFARGGNVAIRVPVLPTVAPPTSLGQFGGKNAIWLLFLNEEKGKGGYLWFTFCGASLRYNGASAGSYSALYYALMVELDAHFGIDRSKREPLRVRW